MNDQKNLFMSELSAGKIWAECNSAINKIKSAFLASGLS